MKVWIVGMDGTFGPRGGPEPGGRDPDRAPAPSVAYFRAVAVDFDGTLADDGRVAADTLAALREVRTRRVTVILVTGRILEDLHRVFPDVDQHVDAVVAENGAVVSTPRGVRRLAAPIDPALGHALTAKGVAWQRGLVLLACSGDDEAVVLDAIRRLGHDYQLARNRGELMVLPAGITKGTGLFQALGDLGLSHHNAIGIGDAENDHALLETCELGVAVANAVDALRARADLVVTQPEGRGVTEVLRGGLLSGRAHIYPRRWQLRLGTDEHGAPVELPASQINVVVAGGTGEGKSYLAGLIAEQLIGLGYSLFVFDPEGDHVGLAEQRGVLVVDARHETVAGEVVQLLRHRYASVVVDLSGLGPEEQAVYAERLPIEIEAQRALTGLPQWVLVDEAHGPLGRRGIGITAFQPAAKGYLMVTWRPDDLSPEALAGVDAVVAIGSPDPSDGLIHVTAAVADVPSSRIARMLSDGSRRAVLAWRHHPAQAVPFTIDRRSTPHLRHEHKYGTAGVDLPRRFYFRTVPDIPTGAVAGNLAQLESELAQCESGVLRHHCPKGDFSRWVAAVFHDHLLARQLAAVEEEVSSSSPNAIVEASRVGLIAALQARRRR